MLKNAYEFLERKGYDLDFPYDKLKANVSYPCEDCIMELREELALYDRTTPTKLYFKEHKGLVIFIDYDLPEDTKYPLKEDCIVLELMDCLRVMILQNDLFDRTLEEIDKENGF